MLLVFQPGTQLHLWQTEVKTVIIDVHMRSGLSGERVKSHCLLLRKTWLHQFAKSTTLKSTNYNETNHTERPQIIMLLVDGNQHCCFERSWITSSSMRPGATKRAPRGDKGATKRTPRCNQWTTKRTPRGDKGANQQRTPRGATSSRLLGWWRDCFPARKKCCPAKICSIRCAPNHIYNKIAPIHREIFIFTKSMFL